MKAQIDHLPLSIGGVRPTQGRTLAVMQVSGGSQSFNSVNTLRLLGRWMRMFTIPNQSSVAMAYKEFDEAGRMKPSSYYDRIVDVMEELVRFTVLLRPTSTGSRTATPSGRKTRRSLKPACRWIRSGDRDGRQRCTYASPLAGHLRARHHANSCLGR